MAQAFDKKPSIFFSNTFEENASEFGFKEEEIEKFSELPLVKEYIQKKIKSRWTSLQTKYTSILETFDGSVDDKGHLLMDSYQIQCIQRLIDFSEKKIQTMDKIENQTKFIILKEKDYDKH